MKVRQDTRRSWKRSWQSSGNAEKPLLKQPTLLSLALSTPLLWVTFLTTLIYCLSTLCSTRKRCDGSSHLVYRALNHIPSAQDSSGVRQTLTKMCWVNNQKGKDETKAFKMVDEKRWKWSDTQGTGTSESETPKTQNVNTCEDNRR